MALPAIYYKRAIAGNNGVPQILINSKMALSVHVVHHNASRRTLALNCRHVQTMQSMLCMFLFVLIEQLHIYSRCVLFALGIGS